MPVGGAIGEDAVGHAIGSGCAVVVLTEVGNASTSLLQFIARHGQHDSYVVGVVEALVEK